MRGTYDLVGGDTSYSVANTVTAQLAGVAPATSAPSFTDPNLKYTVLTLKDTHVDRRAAADTNYGAYARLELGQDLRRQPSLPDLRTREPALTP